MGDRFAGVFDPCHLPREGESPAGTGALEFHLEHITIDLLPHEIRGDRIGLPYGDRQIGGIGKVACKRIHSDQRHQVFTRFRIGMCRFEAFDRRTSIAEVPDPAIAGAVVHELDLDRCAAGIQCTCRSRVHPGHLEIDLEHTDVPTHRLVRGPGPGRGVHAAHAAAHTLVDDAVLVEAARSTIHVTTAEIGGKGDVLHVRIESGEVERSTGGQCIARERKVPC